MSFKHPEPNGSHYYEGHAKWLKEKANAAKVRDTGKPPNPEPTLFRAEMDVLEPDASSLWKPPKDFGMDDEDRTSSYETVVDCLEAVGVDGRALYHRVKVDIKDPDDKGWMGEECCSICHDEQFDTTKGCLLACTDKKKYYCDNCAAQARKHWADNQGRVPCPFCRQPSYFVSTRWIFVDDGARREAARKERRKKYEKMKKSKKRKQNALETVCSQLWIILQPKAKPLRVSLLDTVNMPSRARFYIPKDSDRTTFQEITSQVSDTDGEFFIAGNEIFSYPPWLSTLPIPPIPAEGDTLDPDRVGNVYAARRTTWFDRSRPYLPLLPRFDTLARTHPAFQSLAYQRGRFPMIETRPSTYKLDPEMTRQWDTLEKWLRTMVHRLWTVSNPHSGLMAGFQLWAFPAAYGYMSYTGNKREVQELATCARDTFFPLIAACTFFILVCQQRQETDPNFDWKWQISQYKMHGDNATCKVHAAWIHDLMGSFAGDLRAERIGAIFDPTDPAIIPFLRLFKPVKMPTILRWGTVTQIKEAPYREHVQTADEVDTASAQELNNRASVGKGTPVDSEQLETRSTVKQSSHSLDLAERIKDIPLDPVSGQMPGELIHDFLERRRAAQKEKEAEESHSARHTRLQREKEAENPRAPGKKGPRVWHWEKVTLGEGKDEYFRVRTLLTRGDADSKWSFYSPSQKVFNSWQNCWDVCSDLGDDPTFYEHEMDDDNGDVNNEGPHLDPDVGEGIIDAQSQRQISPMDVDCPELEEGELEEGETREGIPLSTLPATTPAVANTSALIRGVPELDEVEVTTELILRPKDVEAVELEFSHSMLSLAFTRYGFQDHSADSGTLLEVWKHCRSALGNGYFLDRPGSARFAETDPDITTVEQLLAFFGKLYNGVTTLNASFDLYFADSAIRIAPCKPFQVISRKIGENIWYELAEHGDRRALSLLIPDPSSVLQVFRENWGPKLVDVMLQLVQNGIEFHPVAPGPPMPATDHTKGPADSEPRLGYRPNTYKPDKGGGLHCAKAESYQGLHARSSAKKGETGYWGDALTEAEIDLICGVYYCATRWTTDQRVHKYENIHRSWFPRPNAFHSSSFNIGVWSKDAEKWYQHRLEECQEGCAVVSAGKWREGMMLTRHVRKIVTTSQNIAHSFLQARYPVQA
ncbi:hypothetical protein AAF712_003959 [Marasmius tenuissimus]|uniref:RING-type domain-containing protein n=1 Tax=Marasmius tenuissimus TaxID=585030 RepID=A0ABR3A510_9AGAR